MHRQSFPVGDLVGSGERPNAQPSASRTRAMAIGPIVLVVGTILLVGCATLTGILSSPLAARSSFETRLHVLSRNSVIQQVARYRLRMVVHDPAVLAYTLRTTENTPQGVRAVLAEEVDDVVIVDWLVSFSAMGAWTAYNPRNPEAVSIPVSDIPSLVGRSPGTLNVYRLSDRKHLMLTYPVIDDNQAVGAVGFVLTETYADPVLTAQAIPLN